MIQYKTESQHYYFSINYDLDLPILLFHLINHFTQPRLNFQKKIFITVINSQN